MKLKFNLNYCLFVILVIVLLYYVLGTNVYEGNTNIADQDTPTLPGCYVKSTTECARPDGNGGWENGSGAGFNYWANYGYLTFPEKTKDSTLAEIANINAVIDAGMSKEDQAAKCNSTGMLSWCSNSDIAVGKYPKMDWEVISIPYPKGTDYYTTAEAEAATTAAAAAAEAAATTAATKAATEAAAAEATEAAEAEAATKAATKAAVTKAAAAKAATTTTRQDPAWYLRQFRRDGSSTDSLEDGYDYTQSEDSDTLLHCGKGTFWDKIKRACIPLSQQCGLGTVWDKTDQQCVPTEQYNPTDDNFDYNNNYKSLVRYLLSKKNKDTKQSPDSQSQLPLDQNNQYILKSQIVPPVCPACPAINVSNSNKKQQPCPPCARCPEPAFDCKKVPNYNSTNNSYLPNGLFNNNDNLPKPLLNDFSQF